MILEKAGGKVVQYLLDYSCNGGTCLFGNIQWAGNPIHDMDIRHGRNLSGFVRVNP